MRAVEFHHSAARLFAEWLPKQRARPDQVGDLVRWLEKGPLWRWPARLTPNCIESFLSTTDAPGDLQHGLAGSWHMFCNPHKDPHASPAVYRSKIEELEARVFELERSVNMLTKPKIFGAP